MEYMRIGTQFYRQIKQPLTRDVINKIVKWTREALVDDFGKNFIADIPKYDGFCCVPEHVDYSREISNFYNQYEPIDYEPSEKESFKQPELILSFIEHIFGEQYELGLDYLAILYLHPTQILPILCLVSTERKTGKSTFLNLLKKIFGSNMTINTNDDFRSQFNSDWATKLIIGVDETFLEKKEDSERIKNLSTGKSYKAEAKGKDKAEVEFFGKFVLCSNNEDNFIKADKDEIRYWVRKVPVLTNENVNLLNEMFEEIPDFLRFLIERGVKTERKTRMWFSENEIYTPALENLFKGNKSYMEIEFINILKELMLEFETDELYYSQKDIKDLLRNNKVNVSTTQLQRVLDSWNLVTKNSTYEKMTIDSNGVKNTETVKGRFYTFNIKSFINVNEKTLFEYFRGYESTFDDFENADNKIQMLIEFNSMYNANISLNDFEILIQSLRKRIKLQKQC